MFFFFLSFLFIFSFLLPHFFPQRHEVTTSAINFHITCHNKWSVKSRLLFFPFSSLSSFCLTTCFPFPPFSLLFLRRTLQPARHRLSFRLSPQYLPWQPFPVQQARSGDSGCCECLPYSPLRIGSDRRLDCRRHDPDSAISRRAHLEQSRK